MFIDGSIIEIFTTAGRVLTTRAYPTTAPPWRVDASTEATVWDLSAGAPTAGAGLSGARRSDQSPA